ncbi:SMI1/KNR4 family protein [Pseudomonas mediterranea]|uniref:SMI1/KNR4 family protein n=1 Tax=Pseudomonas mediterranea TaxID=183795 RepID=UPI001F4D0398|nr:SMI1/KNR4 family protein [Pseudomonas mediterranea]
MEQIAERLGKIAMKYDLTDGELNGPAELEALRGLSSHLGAALPKSYMDFLKHHNGGEGFIGNNYIIFWKAEELVDFNREYEVEIYAPGIFLFASSGGGEGYGFDINDSAVPIVRVPFIGMDRRYIEIVAQDISGLFARLACEDE